MASYDYVKRTYAFQPEVGRRVRHTETSRLGVITREDRGQGHHVQVRFDGQKFSLPCHPGALEYVATEAPLPTTGWRSEMTEFTPSEQRQLGLDRRLRAEFAAYTNAVGAMADVRTLIALSNTAMELALEITADEIAEGYEGRLSMEPRVA